MPTAVPSRRIEKVVATHHSQNWAPISGEGKWQAAIAEAEQNRPKLKLSND